jgi:hypothetical protein
MNGIIITLIVTAGLVGGLSLAASRGYRIPFAVCLALVIGGIALLVMPAAMSFMLLLANRTPYMDEHEKEVYWTIGGILTFVGVIASIFCRKCNGIPPK